MEITESEKLPHEFDSFLYTKLLIILVLLFVPQIASAASGLPPVMVAIAQCESHFRQFKANGTLVRDYVTGDHVGVFQISLRYHYKAALKHGWDIKTRKGNIAYALYLYRINGLRDWAASRGCWAA